MMPYETHLRSKEGRSDSRHLYGVLDPSILNTKKGISTVKWSFIVLIATALVQMAVVYYSGSVALLADTVHNFGDAATAIPLWIAFKLAHRRPSKRFTYGYGRLEDLAGLAIVLIILFSVIVTGYESVNRLFHPLAVSNLWAVAVASLIGFIGNEAVAVYRTRTGKAINSAALVADGYHAMVDGLTSLAVFLGVLGVWLGYPWADPLIGIIIAGAIIFVAWRSMKEVFYRLIDGVDPEIVDEVRADAGRIAGVKEVTDVRARWLGHQLHVEINLAVSDDISVKAGHEIARDVQHQLIHRFDYLSGATIHVDPSGTSREEHHRFW